MPRIRYVALYPPTGWAGKPWLDEPECDALVKSGRRVAEAYSAAIADLRLTGRSSEVRVSVQPAPPGQDAVTVAVHLELVERMELATALVPVSVRSLGAEARAELALRILDGVMRTLAGERGWSPEDLDRAESQVRECGLEFVWHGPWKAAPDRRREARGVFWLEDHGHGRAVIEVRERGADDAPVVRSPAAPAYCTSAGFARSARTLRWQGDRVTMTPSIDILGRHVGRLRLDAGSAGAGTTVGRSPEPAIGPRPLPDLRVTGSRRVPDTPEIRYVGGGPTNGVPDEYLDGLRTHLGRLREDGTTWWSAADRTLLEITFFITDGDAGVKVRRLRNRTTAEIRRPLGSFAGADAAALALDDARALVEAVTRRMGLTDPPRL